MHAVPRYSRVISRTDSALHDDRGVHSVAISADGSRFLSYARDGSRSRGEVKLWDAASGQLLRKFPAFGDGSDAAVFSPLGKLVLLSSREQHEFFLLYDADSGALKGAGRGPPLSEKKHDAGLSSALCFSLDGGYIAAAAASTTNDRHRNGQHGQLVGVWAVPNVGEMKASITRPQRKSRVYAVALAGDALLVATSVGLESWACFAPHAKDRAAPTRTFASGTQVYALAVQPAVKPDRERRRVAGGLENGGVRVWHIKTGDCDFSGGAGADFDGEQQSTVTAVAWLPGGDMLLSGHLDCTICLWSVPASPSGATPQPLRRFSAVDGGGTAWYLHSFALSADGRTLVCGGKTRNSEKASFVTVFRQEAEQSALAAGAQPPSALRRQLRELLRSGEGGTAQPRVVTFSVRSEPLPAAAAAAAGESAIELGSGVDETVAEAFIEYMCAQQRQMMPILLLFLFLFLSCAGACGLISPPSSPLHAFPLPALRTLRRRYTDRAPAFTSAGEAMMLLKAAEAHKLPGLKALCQRELERHNLVAAAEGGKGRAAAAASSWDDAVLGPTNAAGGGADSGDDGDGTRTYGAHDGAAVLATVKPEPGSSDGEGAELPPAAASKRARRQ